MNCNLVVVLFLPISRSILCNPARARRLGGFSEAIGGLIGDVRFAAAVETGMGLPADSSNWNGPEFAAQRTTCFRHRHLQTAPVAAWIVAAWVHQVEFIAR